MKTIAVKTTLIAAALATAACVQAQSSTSGTGTRVDYLDHKGNIMWSDYPSNNVQSFYVYGNETPHVYAAQCADVASIKFTQWGEESYPVTVETEEPERPGEEIDVTYQVIDNAGNASALRAPGEGGNVLCGKTIRFTVDMPEGTYPVMNTQMLMTGMDGNGGYRSTFYSSIGADYLANFYGWQASYVYSMVFNRQQIQYVAERLDSTGDFTRDASYPNRWYIDITMENEPMSFTFGVARKDSDRLRTVTMLALNELYYQNTNLWNYHAGGEPQFMMPWGDYMSQDFVSGLYQMVGAYSEFYNMTGMSYDNGFSAWVWRMAMSYVLHANMVLSQIDGFTDAPQEVRDWARAQMLALRSVGYLRLMQTFGSRWQDSQQGEAYCAPLELTFPAFDTPLSKMKDIRDRCYQDLDEAMTLLRGNQTPRMESLEIDLLTAKGIKMRLAMLCEDWAVARDLSADILEAKPLTTNEELKSGFFAPAESWIWSASNFRYDAYDIYGTEPEYDNRLYYASVQSYDAVNGSYPASWRYGSNAIDKALFLSIPESDVRGDLYVMPGRTRVRRYRTWDSWYRFELFDSENMWARINNSSYHGVSREFSNYYDGLKPAGVESPAFRSVGDPYDSDYNYMPVMFGNQLKFYQPGASQSEEAYVVFMRTEEALLSHAEACFRLGDESKAINDVNTLNMMRGADVAFMGSGDELFNEIVRTRKIELWGEGHSWYDQKRWNMPITRSHYQEGNTESGNWGINFEENIPIDFANGWRWVIPAAEVQFNPAVDTSLMNYDNVQSRNTDSAPAKAPVAGGGIRPARPVTGMMPITVKK